MVWVRASINGPLTGADSRCKTGLPRLTAPVFLPLPWRSDPCTTRRGPPPASATSGDSGWATCSFCLRQAQGPCDGPFAVDMRACSASLSAKQRAYRVAVSCCLRLMISRSMKAMSPSENFCPAPAPKTGNNHTISPGRGGDQFATCERSVARRAGPVAQQLTHLGRRPSAVGGRA